MSSGFISEAELAEKRKVRQEEWEKVRQPNEPLEVPEEAYDHRSLYERLEEQKQKKQLEYEEAHKLKNMIKGLDDDEVEFLDLVDQKKLEAEQLKELEEKQELLDFRKRVEKLKENALNQRMQAEIQPSKSNYSKSFGGRPQHHLLKGVVVKKRTSGHCISTENENNESFKNKINECCLRKRKRSEDDSEVTDHKCRFTGIGLTCVGILPGLGSYVESSDDSDHSSSASEGNNDDKKYDLTGRQIVYKSKDDAE